MADITSYIIYITYDSQIDNSICGYKNSFLPPTDREDFDKTENCQNKLEPNTNYCKTHSFCHHYNFIIAKQIKKQYVQSFSAYWFYKNFPELHNIELKTSQIKELIQTKFKNYPTTFNPYMEYFHNNNAGDIEPEYEIARILQMIIDIGASSAIIRVDDIEYND